MIEPEENCHGGYAADAQQITEYKTPARGDHIPRAVVYGGGDVKLRR